MGLAGVAQVMRLRRFSQEVRQGQVIKESEEVRFAVTSFSPQEADPQGLLEIARDHWSIENGQHYRRDRTQQEDHCTVQESTSARNLSLLRSLAIFVFLRQCERPGGENSLPDFEQAVHRKPGPLIRRFTQARHEA